MSWWGKHNKTIGKIAAVAAAAYGAYALAPYLAAGSTAAAGTGAAAAGSTAAAGTGMSTANALLTSAAVTGASNAYATHKTNKANAEAIAAQNAYNSPAAQMARLQEAGLNPNLIYGSGNVVGNQSGAASYDYSGYGKAASDALSTYLAVQNHDMAMQLNNADLIQKEINNEISDATKPAAIATAVSNDITAKATAAKAVADAEVAVHEADVITGRNPTGTTRHDSLTNNVITRGFRWIGDKFGSWLGDKVGDDYYNLTKFFNSYKM